MPELYADSYVTVTLDPELGLVRYLRSERPYPSLESVRSVHTEIARVLKTVPGRSLKLLIDSRAAPPRNDPEFEAEIVRAFAGFSDLFVARAALIKSAVGKLQVKRLSRAVWTDSNEPVVFTSQDEALAYLGVSAT
ncbi:MAG TPA: hypothetical protein VFZ61_12840, partial [Polyangiales bacterium]